MRAFHLIFPAQNRTFAGHRWLKICLRTVHLLGVSCMGAWALYPENYDLWKSFVDLTLLSGALMVALELWANAVWLIQLRGIILIFKLICLLVLFVLQEFEAFILFLIIILSAVISHAPGDLRYYSIYHRRRVEALEQQR